MKEIFITKSIRKKILIYCLITVMILIIILVIGFYHNTNTKGFNSYETAHFELYYHNLSGSTLGEMESALEGAYSDTIHFFGNKPENKTQVIIYDDVDSFQRNCFGLFIAWYLPDWAVGASSGDKILMTSPEKPDATHSKKDMIEVAVHEWIHTQIFKIKEYADIWLDEGAATYFAGQKQPLTGDVPELKVMEKQDMNSFAEADGYVYSYYYFQYLSENYKAEDIIKLIETDDYEKSLGISKEKLYTDWVSYLNDLEK